MSNSLVTLSNMRTMAEAVAKSNLFGIKRPEEALALMLIAQAEGCHPAIAIRDFHIIQGKPALKADAMLARFQQAGGRVQWIELTDNKVAAKFSHPAGGEIIIDWTIERAKVAGLGGKDVWKRFPRQMLRARVISEGIRTVFPGVIVGSYTPEEMQDYEGTTIDVQSAYPVPDLSIHSPDGMTQEEKKNLYTEAEQALEVVSDTQEYDSWVSQYHNKLKTNISKARMDKMEEKLLGVQLAIEAKEKQL